MSEQKQGYMQEVDGWLDELKAAVTAKEIDWQEMKRQLKDKLLESYRNGQNAGPRRTLPARRPEDMRRRP